MPKHLHGFIHWQLINDANLKKKIDTFTWTVLFFFAKFYTP